MKPRAQGNTIAIPPALLEEIKAAADEEKRSSEDMLREAIERYLRNRNWRRIFAYGEERARVLGLSEEDIPRLIAEFRQEQRHGR
jgi:metal-responsive CopG/Arc/MetJ family transcriptional regulator